MSNIYNRGKWIKDDNNWLYQRTDGSYPRSEFEMIGHNWFYFDKFGHMYVGWKELNGKKYYFNVSGSMAIGLQKIDNELFYFATDGHMCHTNNRGVLL